MRSHSVRARAWLAGWWAQTKLLLRFTATAAMMPVLGWGPFAHPHINRRALEKAQELAGGGDTRVNGEALDLLSRHRGTFIFAANSADAISTHHIIHDLPIYDYAHNLIPDINTRGKPRFGYALVDEYWRHREKYTEQEGVIAYGWLAHQLADWYPHYARIDSSGALSSPETAPADEITFFSGYADSHPVTGSDFFSPVLVEHRLPNHALIELLYDLLILEKENTDSYLDRNHVELALPRGDVSLITEAARRFAPTHCLIPPEHLPALKKDFDFVIDGMRILIELMKKVRPDLPAIVGDSSVPAVASGWEFIERSVGKVVEGVFCTPRVAFADHTPMAVREEELGGPVRVQTVAVRQKPSTMGSVFFRYAHQLGMATTFAVMKPLLADPVGIKLTGKLIWRIGWEVELGQRLISGLARAVSSRLLQGESKPDPLREFMTALLLDESADLKEAVERFRLAAKPVIAFGRPSRAEPLTPDAVEEMLREGLLEVRIYPASGFRDARLRRAKALNDKTLLFRLNGYPITSPVYRDLLEVKVGFAGNNPECELVVQCKLKRPLASGDYHLFIDAQDQSGVWARNQDLLVHAGQSGRA